jgi:hypothetical protein
MNAIHHCWRLWEREVEALTPLTCNEGLSLVNLGGEATPGFELVHTKLL